MSHWTRKTKRTLMNDQVSDRKTWLHREKHDQTTLRSGRTTKTPDRSIAATY